MLREIVGRESRRSPSFFIWIVIGWCLISGSALAQGDCEGTNETLRRIQLKLANGPTSNELETLYQELKHITTTSCPDSGDAWYLRFKVGQRLGKPPQEIKYSSDQAQRRGSELMRRNFDPFGSNPPAAGGITSAGDTNPPRIRIISPPVTRGQGVVSASAVIVEVEVTDESGVRDVVVGGQPARPNARGFFTAELALKAGDNQIVVSASDIHGNRASESFTLRRGQAVSPTGTASSTGEGQYYALLIAVQDYGSQGIAKLDHPLKDARNFGELLRGGYTFETGNIKLLENPDRRTIIKSIDEMAKRLMPEDHLLIFYAGHGYWDESREQGYWLPSNAQPDDRSEWISNGDLCEGLRAIKAAHILLITDACFSGGIFVTREAFTRAPTHVDELRKLKSRNAMTSGAMTPVPDRSVFLKYLVEKLEANKEKYLLASDLFSLIRTPIINNSPRQADGKIATPRYGVIQQTGDEGGDFIFVRRY